MDGGYKGKSQEDGVTRKKMVVGDGWDLDPREGWGA
jgi:hypothetical protein